MESSDLLIIGAGAAGLSLAARLRETDKRVIVVDARTSFGRDRTWGLWTVRPFGFEEAVAYRYPRWRVRWGGRDVIRQFPGMEYVYVASEKFYPIALERIRGSRVELRLGVRVDDLVAAEGGVLVKTSDGDVFAREVLDSRMPHLEDRPLPPGEVRVLQRFRGWHVHADAPVFDPGVATFMDFDVPQRYGMCFMYVLPFSRTEALCEATWFTSPEFPKELFTKELFDGVIERWLRERMRLKSWDVSFIEQGLLPMSTETFLEPSVPHVHSIGIRGAVIKPSTGYAFHAIQRQSEDLASRFLRGLPAVPPPVRGARVLIGDRVFLSWMTRHWDRAPAIVHRMFDVVAPDRLVRFLQDEGSVADDLSVMTSVPPREFGLETARSWRGIAKTLLGRSRAF